MSRVRVSNDAVPFRRRVSSTRSFLGGRRGGGRVSRRGWLPGADPRRPGAADGRWTTSASGTGSYIALRSFGLDSTSAPFSAIGTHRKTSPYSSPRRGPTCERGRFGEEARSGSVSQAGSVGGERAVESRVGVARARRFATHFFSHRRTRPVMTCACVRAASRWPRVDMARPRVPANPKISRGKYDDEVGTRRV